MIEPIHTACKECVYADYSGITQIGCHLNYITVFKDKKLSILEAYDEDKEFFVINNKKCIGFRNENWFKERNLQEYSLKDKISHHFATNYIKYTLWIDLRNFTSESHMEDLANELVKIQILPKNIIFIRYKNQNIDCHGYHNIQNTLKIARFDSVEWRIQTMLENDFTREGILHDSVITTPNRFMLCVTDKPTDISLVVNKANQIVSEDLDSFNIISNLNRSSIIFPISLYKYHLYSLKKDLLTQYQLYQNI